MFMRLKQRAKRGFTLVELTVAVAIFTVVLGAAAQGLVSYYVIVDLQHQRDVAIQDAKAMLSQMRDVRNTAPDAAFPQVITDVWPDGTLLSGEGLAAALNREPVDNLRNQQISITYTDVGANPLEVMVRCTWQDRRGRTASTQISTRLTDV